MAYKTLASGWINIDKAGKKYLAVTLSQDMKAGEKLYLRKNEFKKEGDKSPDYRYSIKVEDEPAKTQNDVDFESMIDSLS